MAVGLPGLQVERQGAGGVTPDERALLLAVAAEIALQTCNISVESDEGKEMLALLGDSVNDARARLLPLIRSIARFPR